MSGMPSGRPLDVEFQPIQPWQVVKIMIVLLWGHLAQSKAVDRLVSAHGGI